MNLTAIANYFHDEALDVYDSAVGEWLQGAVTGAVKHVDRFLTMFDRPTRRRLLFLSPGNALSGTQRLVRLPASGEVYLVGNTQQDADGVHGVYSISHPLHQAQGPATVKRFAPTGPPEDPGHATYTTTVQTWAASEFRSQREDKGMYDLVFGNFWLYLPLDVHVEDGWFVELDRPYKVEEVYQDSGFRTLRVRDKPNEYINLVYRVKGATAFNHSTQTLSTTYTDYDVSAMPLKREIRDEPSSEVTETSYRFMIPSGWIGVTPRLGDVLRYQSRDYTVMVVDQDPLALEWRLTCRV